MAEKSTLQGKEREIGLRALNTLLQLLRQSPVHTAATVRDDIEALVQLSSAGDAGEMTVAGASDLEKMRKLLAGRERVLIENLAGEMGLDTSLFRELYHDLIDFEDDQKGRSHTHIEVSDLEGPDLTEDLLRIELYQENRGNNDFSEWVMKNVISEGITEAFVKIDWDEFKNTSYRNRIPWLLERRTQFPIEGIKITPVIVCTASDLYDEILVSPGASGMLASGVKWIRKRNK